MPYEIPLILTTIRPRVTERNDWHNKVKCGFSDMETPKEVKTFETENLSWPVMVLPSPINEMKGRGVD